MELLAPTSDAERGCAPAVVRAFHAAVVEVDAPDGRWTLTPVTDGRPAIESFPPGLSRIPIVTAYNPLGLDRPEHINVAAQQALAKRLTMAALPVWPALGRSPDGTWREPSLAIPELPTQQATSVALSYDQAAFFLWTPGVLTIVWTPASRIVRADVRFVRALFEPHP